MSNINIVGAGIAGLSAAINLAKGGTRCNLISLQPSERAQSVMAEGGINAALDTMGEHDTVKEHFLETVKGGVYLADENAVFGLVSHAPEIVNNLLSLGAPFNMSGERIVLRNFGGQKKKRTAFAKSSTGKIIMTSLIDEARKYESRGLIKRYSHHRFLSLKVKNNACVGLEIKDLFSGDVGTLYGCVILCCGSMNSLFPGFTTGTVVNTGDVTAKVFSQGVELANLEFIQYHPTTVQIPGKRMLISEAARGEGGRLFTYRNSEKYYFMEEKYPTLGNLMPRDVVSRETAKLGTPVYLDMTGIDDEVWNDKLSDLREECIRLLSKDPKREFIEVSPGIHYFMGGIYVDLDHKTSMKGLFAAGECACQYHGANRLGGNSTLGALYGGRVAASSAKEYSKTVLSQNPQWKKGSGGDLTPDYEASSLITENTIHSLGVLRNGETLSFALENLNSLDAGDLSENDKNRLLLAKAAVTCALERKESRGAHTRLDFPETNDKFRATSVVKFENNIINFNFRDIPRMNSNDL